MEIVPEEAETVRLICRMFMQGKTPHAIAKYLTEKEIPTPTGKSEWRHRTVEIEYAMMRLVYVMPFLFLTSSYEVS